MQHLRHVEKDVWIPKIMREKARERCSEQLQDFMKCCKNSGILTVEKCRKENPLLKEYLTAHYNDPAFYEECKMEYLKEGKMEKNWNFYKEKATETSYKPVGKYSNDIQEL
uniref:COX assembly mitochondrial protein n=1 Tax=Piliocolobus tephrosceles TaxID=591936 RepID=A0A8C9LXY1_9PRIM